MFPVFQDPREQADFTPEHYPTANGQAPSPQASLRNERIMLEFLTVYYRLNRAYAGLLAIRRGAASAKWEQMEREALCLIEQGLIARDKLEDFYAPYGVIVEPTVRGGFTKDLTFRFGKDGNERQRSELVSLEAYVPISLPADFDWDDLPIRVRERPPGGSPPAPET